MDFMTIIGLLAGLATVYYVMSEGNLINMLLNPVAFVLVAGGTLSATLISYPWGIIRAVIPSIFMMFRSTKDKDSDRQELIEELTRLARHRRQSVESLQTEVGKIEDLFLSNGLQMIVDGMEPEVIKDTLEKEILFTRQRHHKVSSVFRTMATLSPIFGLLGTLIGVVQVLRNLADPANLGEGMAIAITTTFYGIFAANFLFLPAAIKLNEQSENNVMNQQLMTEGIIAIQQADLPMMVRKKLDSFIIGKLSKEGGAPKKEQ
jgi:chemotaxis protein MotA